MTAPFPDEPDWHDDDRGPRWLTVVVIFVAGFSLAVFAGLSTAGLI